MRNQPTHSNRMSEPNRYRCCNNLSCQRLLYRHLRAPFGVSPNAFRFLPVEPGLSDFSWMPIDQLQSMLFALRSKLRSVVQTSLLGAKISRMLPVRKARTMRNTNIVYVPKGSQV